MTYYKINYFRNSIEQIEVERETSHYVYIKKDRCTKNGSYGSYVSSLPEAINTLKQKLEKDLKFANERVMNIEKDLQEFIEYSKNLNFKQ